jgi:NADPH-dependent 2,4-dienoyl-CoA reductase/sulfur reductase-like enzyme
MASMKRREVVIVGGGAAGMSCASTLAAHPEYFKVTIIERMPVTGGQATSISLDEAKYGTGWMNDGVQGGSPVGFPSLARQLVTDSSISDIQTHFQFFQEVWP